MSEIVDPLPARPAKSASAFRTISEVADDLDLPPHVLRFWESKFPQLKPMKRGGGRRYYRPEDIVLLRRIRQCLYQDGYTIRGVQKLLGDAPGGYGARAMVGDVMPSLFPLDATSDPTGEPKMPARPPRTPRRRPTRPDDRAALEQIRRELLEIRAMLDELLPPPKIP